MPEALISLAKPHFWVACVIAALYLIPVADVRAKTAVLAIFNCAFLASFLHWSALPVFLALLMWWWLLGLVPRVRGPLLVGLIAVVVAVLFLFHKLSKAHITGTLPTLEWVLSTLGFSYVALRMLEMLRAIQEQRHKVPSLASTINYLLPFNMLAAGPIQSYDDFVAKSISVSQPDFESTLAGFERIARGLFKKFVLAYFIQKLFLTDFQVDGVWFFIEVQLFFLWLYLDFSAYSDIAVGIGRLLGVNTPENFNKPYLARNVIDFWERWHMTLSGFIRRNLFIPVQLFFARRSHGRHPLLPASVAFLVAFILCGLWHGLTINFLLWGLIHACGLIVANLYRNFLKQRLGTKGLKQYQANKLTLWLARLATYEFVAFSLVVLFVP